MILSTPKDYKPNGVILENILELKDETFGEMKQRYSKQGYFSASTTPTLLGLYGSAYEVFDNMRADTPLDLSHNPKVRFGNVIEEWIAETASNLMNVDVFFDPYMIGNKDDPWICCNKDYHVSSVMGHHKWAMECKSTSSWAIIKKLGEDGSEDTAEGYYLQCQHQMLCDDLEGVFNPVLIIKESKYINVALDLIESGEDPNLVMEDIPWEMRVFRVKRNEEVIGKIKNHLGSLRKIFLDGGNPTVDSSDATTKVLKNKERSGDWVDVDSSKSKTIVSMFIDDIFAIREKRSKAKSLSDEAKALENKLLEALGDHCGISIDGRAEMEVKKVTQTRFDTSRFKKEEPELYVKYNKDVISNRIKYFD